MGWARTVEGDSTPHDPHHRTHSYRSPTFPHLSKVAKQNQSRRPFIAIVVVLVVVVAGT
jgi:hypothetical protein